MADDAKSPDVIFVNGDIYTQAKPRAGTGLGGSRRTASWPSEAMTKSAS